MFYIIQQIMNTNNFHTHIMLSNICKIYLSNRKKTWYNCKVW